MNKKQYNNIIEHTLKHEVYAQTEDSLETARAIFNNMGVALPQGDMKHVYEVIKTDDYMGWRSCTMQEAQEAANNGTATIGISEERIVVLAANDDEEPVVENAVVMTLSENVSTNELTYYAYSNTTPASLTVNGWLRLYQPPYVSGRIVAMPEGCNPNTWFAFSNYDEINPWAIKTIGDTNSVHIGNKGELIDDSGRYWVAVGPKVMNPDFPNNKKPMSEDMRYGSKIDVLLEHDNGEIYLLRTVVGDCKEHTYSNGIYQTGYAFPNGGDYHEENVDGSVIEFIGALLPEGLDDFRIVYLMVRD